ncbi:hypothetical protein SHD_0446 [Shewanella decolorationis S12]|uniref:Uncharacterized protein n=1 Tax=Shewanella decolorationis S12 TaxID=1353536 RepID=A0ABP2ZCP9_9GAMM|nr:hypothetical protein SHD_0446 [Shewanella decolorationis S12]
MDAAAVAMNRISSYSKKNTFQGFYVKNNQLETISCLDGINAYETGVFIYGDFI